MKQITHEMWPINQLLIFWVSVSILVLIFKYAADLIAPFLIALSLAIILSPLLKYLERKRIPKALSLVLIIIVSLIPTVVIGGYITEELKEFANNFHETKQHFNAFLEKFTNYVNGFGVGVTQEDINKMLEKSNLAAIITGLVAQAKDQFSNVFLIFFYVAFMLMESDFFYNKMLKIKEDYTWTMGAGMQIVEKIQSYFLIKVKTSLITAVWIFAVLWYLDINYAYLWASLVFFLNFIPVIGSILAAIPAIVMALVDQSLGTALWVTAWYVIVNVVVGNILEPRIMGQGLGLSALVIFISMTFWGWVFGPTGMILSVPLTMVVQYIFEQYRETKWISVLLSNYEKEK